MKTTVVNLKVSEYDIFIGRKSATPYHFGNPFHIGPDGTRAQVIEKFDHWLHGVAYSNIESKRREWIIKNLYMLRDKRLGCYCVPLACHGDVYVKELEGGRKIDADMLGENLSETPW